MNVVWLVEFGLILVVFYGILIIGKVKNGEFKESKFVF